MDKNTIIGFLLIAAIVIGFTWLSKPSEEEIAQRKRYTDSIALVQQQQQLAQSEQLFGIMVTYMCVSHLTRGNVQL